MPIRVQPDPEQIKTIYGGFRGVDLSKDPLLVDRQHAAYALNLISDKNGLPEKRVGYRQLHKLESPINGLFHGFVGNEQVFIAHGGTKLYKWTDDHFDIIRENVLNSKSSAFFSVVQSINEKATDKEADKAVISKTKLFILTGGDYLCYDGETVKDVAEIATIPVVLIAKAPTGGGTALQPVNLIQPKRTEKFAGDASAKIYSLAAKTLDAELVKVIEVTANGEIEKKENTDFTVNRETGQVTFTTAPPAPPVKGEDNIYITYAKTVAGYADRVKKCSVFAYYGLGGSNRVFITGNPEYRSYDRWCEINDPTYFPDINYSIVGTDNTKIMGYAKIGEYLIIIKEDNSQDATIFVRAASFVDNKAAFPLKQGVTGTGAISPYSFVNLIDEPLFLSRTGIYAITSNTVTAERTLQNRSTFINVALGKEEKLNNAVACEWNGYYLLGINENVYLMDSRQKTPTSEANESFSYECYLWDSVPATCFLSINGLLYFGTSDGKICKFNTDVETLDKFLDIDQAINAVWETKADNDGMSALLKTMQKKGNILTIKPSYQTGADIYVSIDGEPYELLISKRFSLFSWENLDFNCFTFFTSETPKTILINLKIKKYLTLQFKIVNNKKNQSFGIYELCKEFIIKNYKKR